MPLNIMVENDKLTTTVTMTAEQRAKHGVTLDDMRRNTNAALLRCALWFLVLAGVGVACAVAGVAVFNARHGDLTFRVMLASFNALCAGLCGARAFMLWVRMMNLRKLSAMLDARADELRWTEDGH
jgi:hypothetical protein